MSEPIVFDAETLTALAKRLTECEWKVTSWLKFSDGSLYPEGFECTFHKDGKRCIR